VHYSFFLGFHWLW